MRLPTMQGIIDRRILVNYRLDPEAAARVLPAPFRPKLCAGHAVGGICLIRLKQIRPAFLPALAGVGSENAAHRLAVEWDADGETRQGVYIPRRDSSSRLNAMLGGRVVPGEHHHAAFEVSESATHLEVSYRSDDGGAHASVVADVVETFPADSIFGSLAAASAFFEQGSLGYSATIDPSRFDGIELDCRSWSVQPLSVRQVRSSFFEDPAHFPAGSAVFDCALLMRGVEHQWHTREDLSSANSVGRTAAAENSAIS